MTSNFFSLLPQGHYIFYLDVSLIEASFCIASKKYLRPQFVKIASQCRRTYIIKGCALFLCVFCRERAKWLVADFLGNEKFEEREKNKTKTTTKADSEKDPDQIEGHLGKTAIGREKQIQIVDCTIIEMASFLRNV